MPEPKKKQRRCTPVVVRPPRLVPITPEDHELAVHAIATMIARWWDANGAKRRILKQLDRMTRTANDL